MTTTLSEERKVNRIRYSGAVYLLRDDASGLVKIGWARNVQRRCKQLQTGNPSALRVSEVIAGTRSAEGALHSLFKERRISGEWFDDRDHEVSAVFARLANLGI